MTRSAMQSLARGLEVLRALANMEFAATLTEVSETCQLSRATTRRLLLSLEEMGYAKQQNRLWSTTIRSLDLAQAYLQSCLLPEAALRPMRDLASATNQSVSLSVMDGNSAVYIQRIPGEKIIRAVINIGTRLPLFCTAMGRVLLSGLSDQDALGILENEPRNHFTENTITDPLRILAEAQTIRQQGYCLVVGEYEPTLITLAVPVYDSEGSVVAALNLPDSHSAFVYEDIPRKVSLLLDASNKITRAYLAERS